MSITSIHELLGEHQGTVNENIDTLVGDKEIFKVGEGQYMYSDNSDLVAFEIFRGIAPNINFDEYQKYKNEEHILVRLSRDREMLSATVTEEDNPDPKRRGNDLSL